ncbi:MAG TPA: hypothetical protein VJ598_10390, partial [Albitalea sp.]|nr:hypothetical protein [Albitalea sp.]
LQTLARADAPAAGAAPRLADAAILPAPAMAASEFALPADQLVAATLIGLQVEAAGAWPLLRHGFDAAMPDEPPELTIVDEDASHDEAPAQDADAPEPPPHDAVVEDPADIAWCEPLTRSLRRALAAGIPPQALLVAADQWRSGRCVVFACPQGDDPAGPAWAFVLWPRRPAASLQPSRDKAQPLALFGLRVEARLQWSALPRGAQWCHVRVVKEHHPRRGRQLVAMANAHASDDAPHASPCEVQLGPVLARSLHWCDVCVHINAARRFWAALGAQWSVNVVVCSQPLASPHPHHPDVSSVL